MNLKGYLPNLSAPAKLVVVAVVSVAGGGAGGYLVAKKQLTTKYEQMANQEIEAARIFYSRLHKKTEDTQTPQDFLESMHGTEALHALVKYGGLKDHEVDGPYETEEELEVETTTAEAEPTTPEVVTNIFSEHGDAVPGFNYEEEVKLRTGEEPYIITQEEFLQNETNFEQIQLTYFEGDGVLVDDRDVPIPDEFATIGEDNLVRFGHGSKDHNIVYVRNEHLEADFEVRRSHGSYAKEVLGFDVEDESELKHSDRRVRKFRGYDD